MDTWLFPQVAAVYQSTVHIGAVGSVKSLLSLVDQMAILCLTICNMTGDLGIAAGSEAPWEVTSGP